MKTGKRKNGNGNGRRRKIRIAFARNGKAKDIKIWMRYWTRTDPHFV